MITAQDVKELVDLSIVNIKTLDSNLEKNLILDNKDVVKGDFVLMQWMIPSKTEGFKIEDVTPESGISFSMTKNGIMGVVLDTRGGFGPLDVVALEAIEFGETLEEVKSRAIDPFVFSAQSSMTISTEDDKGIPSTTTTAILGHVIDSKLENSMGNACVTVLKMFRVTPKASIEL